MPLLLQGQLHGPDPQWPHVGQRAEHPLLAVRLRGLEGQAPAFPHSPVAAFSRGWLHPHRLHQTEHWIYQEHHGAAFHSELPRPLLQRPGH